MCKKIFREVFDSEEMLDKPTSITPLLLTSWSSNSRRVVQRFLSFVWRSQMLMQTLSAHCLQAIVDLCLSFAALCKPANYLRSVCPKLPYLKPEFLRSQKAEGMMKTEWAGVWVEIKTFGHRDWVSWYFHHRKVITVDISSYVSRLQLSMEEKPPFVVLSW